MRDTVEEYYGKILKNSGDLKTNACTTSSAPSAHIAAILRKLHEETLSTYYGCGLVYPPKLQGAKVLDLGCGTGRDCYVLSHLVGESGEVIGIDMTDEQLEIARRHVAYHARAFDYSAPNVSFKKGYLEHLNELELEPNSFDVIVSNCVINLAIDKPAVLQHAFDLLKPGGELYFSDVYCDRRVPETLTQDPTLYGECLGGALYWNDFINIAKNAGFFDPRLVEDSPITITDPQTITKVADIRFYSATYRLFKLPELEPACEDYGQAVIYKGTIPDQAEVFVLDKHHHIQRGRVFPVCGNTWRMLEQTRFKEHFEFIGTWETHYGIFEGCGTALPFNADSMTSGSGNPGGCC
ncbi:MAG: methyltransferase domain-containing protein [Gammaproteobacteria bacterium]